MPKPRRRSRFLPRGAQRGTRLLTASASHEPLSYHTVLKLEVSEVIADLLLAREIGACPGCSILGSHHVLEVNEPIL